MGTVLGGMVALRAGQQIPCLVNPDLENNVTSLDCNLKSWLLHPSRSRSLAD